MRRHARRKQGATLKAGGVRWSMHAENACKSERRLPFRTLLQVAMGLQRSRPDLAGVAAFPRELFVCLPHYRPLHT